MFDYSKIVAFLPRKTEYLDTTKPLIYTTPTLDKGAEAFVYEGVIDRELADRYLIEGTKCPNWHDSPKCLVGVTTFLSKKEALESVKAHYEQYLEIIDSSVRHNSSSGYEKILDVIKAKGSKEVREYLEYPVMSDTYGGDNRKRFWSVQRHFFGNDKPFIWESVVTKEESYRYLVDNAQYSYYFDSELLKRDFGVTFFDSFESALSALIKKLEDEVARHNEMRKFDAQHRADCQYALTVVEAELNPPRC